MTTYYVNAELSRYLEEHGGKDFLARIIQEHKDGDVRDVPGPVLPRCRHCGQPVTTMRCPHCGNLA